MSEFWLLVSAGQGPAECQWAVQRLCAEVCTEAKAAGLTSELIETTPGDRGLPRSALITLTGSGAADFARSLAGTVQWIGPSPFRPKHKRKNWFIGVFALPPPEESALFDPEDVTFQTMRASGPGGQHVNTTDSAVRATHAPSGVTVVAREKRSQHANKRLSLLKIAAILSQRQVAEGAAQAHETWQQHHNVERGNPVRIYEGAKFRRRERH